MGISTQRSKSLVSGKNVLITETELNPMSNSIYDTLCCRRFQMIVSTVAASCGVGPASAVCSCSVTVRVDSEWATLNMCTQLGRRQQPKLQRSSLPGRKHRLHVLETRPDAAWLVRNGLGFGGGTVVYSTFGTVRWYRDSRCARMAFLSPVLACC